MSSRAAEQEDARQLNRRGVELAQGLRFDEALASFEQALMLVPHSAEILANRGNALRGLKRLEAALASYDQALAMRPDFAEVLYNRGITLAELKQLDAALASFDRHLEIAPDNANVLNHRAAILAELKRYEEAVASYDRAVACKPDHAPALNNRGAALTKLGRFEEAIADYDAAIAINPGSEEAHHNRAQALTSLGRVDEALESFARALAIKPDYPEGRFDESLCRLLNGDLVRGWQGYEWRLKKKDRWSRGDDFAQPAWLGGQDVRGKTVLLYAEQGFGDTIQFCRYASLVAERGAKVILEVQAPLRSLLESVAGPAKVVSREDLLPAFDYHCSLLSLPFVFQTTLETIPGSLRYITPPRERVEAWRARLGAAPSPRIGLVWSGHPRHGKDHLRSLSLEALADVIQGRCFSLQKEIRDSDRVALAKTKNIEHFGEEIEDFADTAALASHMDLVISVDTSVAHLAGALGKPVWILLPRAPDWRWLLERDDSPWYPSARLFRQPQSGEWDGVLRRVAEELRRFAAR
jgi:tetratricopeptide (TPR) repeat protein